MSVTFDQFFQAIAGQESGGNPNAVNARTGAAGIFQIMPENIGPWSQQYLGRRISLAEYKASPQLQTQLARAVLKSYYDKYGARGAASAWYSGNPNGQSNYHRFNANEPSIGEYVDQVMARAGKAPATGGVDTGGATIQTTQKDPLHAPDLGLPGSSQSSAPDPLASHTAPGMASLEADPLAAHAADPFAPGGRDPFSTAPTQSPTDGQNGAAGSSSQFKSGPTSFRDRVITTAMQQLGTPYSWGGGGVGGASRGIAQGAGTIGFDCSSLLQYAFGKNGYSIPRLSWDQIDKGTRTLISKLRPGDLVGFNGGSHIALYIGNGQILEAPHTGADVRIRTLGPNEDAFGVALNLPGD